MKNTKGVRILVLSFLFLTSHILLSVKCTAQSNSTQTKLEGTTWKGETRMTVPFSGLESHTEYYYTFSDKTAVRVTWLSRESGYMWTTELDRLTGRHEREYRYVTNPPERGSEVGKYKQNGNSVHMEFPDGHKIDAVINNNHMNGSAIFHGMEGKWYADRVAEETSRSSISPDSPYPNVMRAPNGGLRPPYAGQYSGTWITTYSDLGGVQRGEWSLSVDTDGKVTGKEVNTTFNATADINGSLSKDGHIELSLQYGGIFKNAPPSLIRGNITNAEKRHLKGTLSQYRGDKITTVYEIDLTPISIELPASSTNNQQSEAQEAVWKFREEAWHLMKQENFIKAIEYYTLAINLAPDDPRNYFSRGHAKFKLKDYREAIADYDRAIRIYSTWDAEEKARKAKGGSGVTQKSFEVFDNLPQAYHDRGVAKDMLGDKVGACDDLHKSCDMRNDDVCKTAKTVCNQR